MTAASPGAARATPRFTTAHVTAWCDASGSLLVEHQAGAEGRDPWDVASITETFAGALRLRRERQARRIIERYGDVLGRGPVLDYGCGQRVFLEQLLASGYDATGCDVGVPNAGAAPAAVPEERFVRLDRPWTVPATHQWTTVVLLDVLEHHPEPEAFLRLLGGPRFLVVKVPLVSGPVARLARAGVRLGRPRLMETLLLVGDVSPHLWFFTAEGLDRVARSAGYVRRRRLNLSDVGAELADRVRGDLAGTARALRPAMAAVGAGLAAIAPVWPDTAVFLYERAGEARS